MADLERALVKSLLSRLEGSQGFIQLVLGPRQVGKTTAVEQVLAHWKGPKHYASADLPAPPDATWVRAQWQIARLDTQGPKRPGLLVIDEVQKIARWADVVKGLYEEDRRNKLPLRVVLLGSSSLHVQKGAQESLAGRYELHFCPHWSSTECAKAFGWSLDEWIFFGGYPGAAALKTEPERWAQYVSTSLIESVLGRDVLQLSNVSKPALLRQLYMLATHVPAQILSFNKMLGQLSDAGNTVTLASYLKLFESAFLLSGLNLFSGNLLKARASSPKLVFWNNALFTSLSGLTMAAARRDAAYWGRLVENAVGAHLLNHLPTGAQLFYWRVGDAEVDYVLTRGRTIVAIEVKSGRQRALGGLEAFLKAYPAAKPFIVGSGGLALDRFFAADPSALMLG